MNVRMNMRYRGPMESHKEEAMRRQIDAGLFQLKERFEALTNRVTSHEQDVYVGPQESILEFPMPIRLGHMERNLKIIERGVNHE